MSYVAHALLQDELLQLILAVLVPSTLGCWREKPTAGYLGRIADSKDPQQFRPENKRDVKRRSSHA
jgi:hypothetical protein